MKLGVIGLGLIGGSLAKDALAAGWTVLGCDSNPEHVRLASTFLPQTTTDWHDLLDADLIAVCVPPTAIAELLPQLLDQAHGVIFDVASVKGAIEQAVAGHPRRGRYVSAHPMAGRELSGPTAAIAGLYKGCPCLCCDLHKSDPDAVHSVREFLEGTCGLITTQMTTDEHDRHVGMISHLPHALAFVLAQVVAESGCRTDLAGRSLPEMIRIARSSPELWTDIFISNASATTHGIQQTIDKLTALQQAIAIGDKAQISALLRAANP